MSESRTWGELREAETRGEPNAANISGDLNASKMWARYIAETTYDHIPPSVVDVTKRSFLDLLGVLLATGTLGEGIRPFVNLAMAEGGKQESTIIGFGAKASACMAALANGSMAHALDFLNSHLVYPVHPYGATLPAALAMAESVGNVSGKEFITALTVASDIVCRLGLAVKVNLREYGFDGEPILGAFGATAAACKLLGLNPQQILDAFSLTLCQASCSGELINSPRSVIRGILDAFPAKAGVLSALLARDGVAGGYDQPFEGKLGFFTMYVRGNYDSAPLTDKLGEVFEGANVRFKPWPVAVPVMYAIGSALQLVDEYEIAPGDIKRIHVVTSPRARYCCEPLERKRSPATVTDAKQSIPFAVAAAFAYKRVGLSHFTREALADPAVLALTRKTTVEIDTALKPVLSSFRLEVEMTQDRITSRKIEANYGEPRNPMSDRALVEKFMDCARHSVKRISGDDLNKVAHMILNLENVDNIGEITQYV